MDSAKGLNVLAEHDDLAPPRLNGVFNQGVEPRSRPVEHAATESHEEAPVIVVHDRRSVIRVPATDVLYLKAELKYVTLRTSSHTYVVNDSLSDLEELLGSGFLRIHRNALVARRAVSAVERRVFAGDRDAGVGEAWAVCVHPVGEWLAVSRRQVTAVRQALSAQGR